MTHSTQMLKTHPARARTKERVEPVAACIDACFDCAETCSACADACLSEEDQKQLVTCIRLNLHCADVCQVTGRLLSRPFNTGDELFRAQLQATLVAVRTCATECERHAGTHEHCRVCAEACRRCEESCRALIGGSLPSKGGIQ